LKLEAGSTLWLKNLDAQLRVHETAQWLCHEVYAYNRGTLAYGTVGGHPLHMSYLAESERKVKARRSCIVLMLDELDSDVTALTRLLKGQPLYLTETSVSLVGKPILNRAIERTYGPDGPEREWLLGEYAPQLIDLYWDWKVLGALPASYLKAEAARRTAQAGTPTQAPKGKKLWRP